MAYDPRRAPKVVRAEQQAPAPPAPAPDPALEQQIADLQTQVTELQSQIAVLQPPG